MESFLSSIVSGVGSTIGSVRAGSSSKYEWHRADIDWAPSYRAGSDYAKESATPMMVVVHQEDCPASSHLARKMTESKEVQQLSEEFVMVHLDAKEAGVTGVPHDGSMLPAVLFFDHKGRHIPEVKGFPKWKTFVSGFKSEKDILTAMKEVKGNCLREKVAREDMLKRLHQ